MSTWVVTCSRCGKGVSNNVTVDAEDGLIVRAWVECPECIEASVPCACGHPRRDHRDATGDRECLRGGPPEQGYACGCPGFRERPGPHAYGVEVQVNPGRPSAYWRLDDDEQVRETIEEAAAQRQALIDVGHDPAQVRLVALIAVEAP